MSPEKLLTPEEVRQIITSSELTSPIAEVFRSNIYPLRDALKAGPQTQTPDIYLYIADQIEELYPSLEDPLSQRALIEIARETQGSLEPNHLVGQILAVTYASFGGPQPMPDLANLWLKYHQLPGVLDLSDLIYMQSRLTQLNTKNTLLSRIIPANKPSGMSFDDLAWQLRRISVPGTLEYNETQAQMFVEALHNFSDPASKLLTYFSRDEFGNGISSLRSEVAQSINQKSRSIRKKVIQDVSDIDRAGRQDVEDRPKPQV